MPKYTFKCENCLDVAERSLSIPKFLKIKADGIPCDQCSEGTLVHQVVNVTSKIEKSKEQMIMESQEEVRKTIDKIRAGDSRTINDVYGDRPNAFKHNGVL